MTKIYTATIYGYTGKDKLDVTVKGHSQFGPTWDMVMGTKRGTMTKEVYVEKYYILMRQLYTSNRELFEAICTEETVTFCCYCKPGAFCHRYMLANIFTRLGCTYIGERA